MSLRYTLTTAFGLIITLSTAQVVAGDNRESTKKLVQSAVAERIRAKNLELTVLNKQAASLVKLPPPPLKVVLIAAGCGGVYSWYMGIPEGNARNCSSFALGSALGAVSFYGVFFIHRAIHYCEHNKLKQCIAALQDEIKDLQTKSAEVQELEQELQEAEQAE